MQNINKKAISDVIATVLLITITLACAGILSNWAIPFVQNSINLAPTFDCIDMQANPPIKIVNVCYNQNTKDIELKLQRSPLSNNITEISFNINSQLTTNPFICKDSCESCKILEKGITKTYFFQSEDYDSQTKISFNIGDCAIRTIKVEKC